MNKLFLVISIFLLISQFYTLPSINSHTYKNRVKQNKDRDSLINQLTDKNEKWFTSRVDNFDGSNTKTFQHRYFVNASYWKGAQYEAPVFLCVGGEGPPLDSSVVISSVHCDDMIELGSQLGALLLAIEHRYYGKSIPTDDFSTANLKYLSSHQALADIAGFVGYIQNLYNLTKSNKWVTFGGSYPGMLSGWMRIKYPHLIHASVSSSSPVRPQLNFKGYLDVVGRSWAQSIVGGSQQCLDVIVQGNKLIGQLLLTKDGKQQLSKMFNLCNGTLGDGAKMLEDVNNQAIWIGQGLSNLGSYAQENDPSCQEQLCNIEKVCQFLLDDQSGSNPLTKLASYSQQVNQQNCVDIDNEEYFNSLRDTTLEGGVGRIWTYQTCNEFAFFQTCENNSQCPFTQGINTLDYQLLACQVAFNMSREIVQQRVEFSTYYYGSDQPQGSRVLYVNGNIDPWSYLGINSSPDEQNLPTLMVNGASHHFWTHQSKDSDSKEVKQARQIIWKTIQQWLLEDEKICLNPSIQYKRFLSK